MAISGVRCSLLPADPPLATPTLTITECSLLLKCMVNKVSAAAAATTVAAADAEKLKVVAAATAIDVIADAFFWEAYLSIEDPLTRLGPVHP